MKSIVIFGGSGFIGKHIIRRLAKIGYKIIVPYQMPTNETKLRLLGNFGQITPIQFSYLNEPRILKILENADVCINLKTHWNSNKISFNQSIYEFNKELIHIIKQNKVTNQIIYFSGIGVHEETKSLRTVSIHKTEQLLTTSFENSIIIRPSIIIGLNDNFLSKLIPIIKMLFFVPIFGDGKNKFQPVFVDDVALIIEKIVKNNIKGSQIIELGGPTVYSYKEFYELICKGLKKRRKFIYIPMIMAKILISIGEKTPFSPINLEQLSLFEKDNILSNKFKNFSDFNINPQDCSLIVKKIAENK